MSNIVADVTVQTLVESHIASLDHALYNVLFCFVSSLQMFSGW